MSRNANEPMTLYKSPLSKSTTEFFESESTIDRFVTQFFLPKQHDYHQNIIEFYSNTHNFIHENYQIPNGQGEKLYATVFRKSKVQQAPKSCIVYCHGFGSTRLEAVHILKVLKPQIALCCFDFSGSGKSEGNITTYGAKQKQDIHSVICYLQEKLNFSQFVLWGRSMGATACLLYSIKYQQSHQILNQKVIFQIVDSPFVSFESIALELAKKYINMPQFGTNIVLDIMRKHCNTLAQYNPFSVNLNNISSCKVPTLFIYSETDDIVCCKNSQQLCSKFTAFYQKMIITQNHNAPRAVQTLSEVIKKVQIQLKKCELSKKNGIIFRSFISNSSKKSKSNKKGIEKSLKKDASVSSISDLSKPSSIHKTSDYGINNQPKFQTPKPHCINSFLYDQGNKQGTGEYFTKKPTSYSTFPHQIDLKNYQSLFIQSPSQTPRNKNLANQIVFKNKNQGPNNNQPSYNTQGVCHQNNIALAKQQTIQNVYQMRKYEVINKNHKKQIKRFSSPVNISKAENPLTYFTREKTPEKKTKQNTPYRQGQRPQSCQSKKLNISLSKLKTHKNPSVANIQRASIKDDLYMNTEREQKVKENQQNISNNPTNLNRPISPLIQPIKSVFKTKTPTTKTPSLSSSMDNLHFLGAMKSPLKTIQPRDRSRKMFENDNGKLNHQQNSSQKILPSKTRSSGLVYYDKSLYRYGI